MMKTSDFKKSQYEIRYNSYSVNFTNWNHLNLDMAFRYGFINDVVLYSISNIYHSAVLKLAYDMINLLQHP